FFHVTDLINHHLVHIHKSESNATTPAALGKALVVCESGNERSAATVAAYCMQVFEINMQIAVQVVHERRFCINVDEQMRHVLFAYEDILQAKRDVAQATDTNPSALSNSGSNMLHPNRNLAAKPLKRTLEDDEDEDMENDDMLRFGNCGFKPFTDAA
ncbi:MAG: dual specificity protein phosphatase family protein, partial [Janthinobacterium lividum]